MLHQEHLSIPQWKSITALLLFELFNNTDFAFYDHFLFIKLSKNFFLSEVNKRKTVAAIVAKNDMYLSSSDIQAELAI